MRSEDVLGRLSQIEKFLRSEDTHYADPQPTQEQLLATALTALDELKREFEKDVPPPQLRMQNLYEPDARLVARGWKPLLLHTDNNAPVIYYYKTDTENTLSAMEVYVIEGISPFWE